jgi:polyferredoxin
MRLKSLRLLSQVIFLFLSIIGIAGFAVSGLIYPYFFCNASPGATCVCPLWALEHASILLNLDFKLALAMFLYIFGFLGIVGVIFGRTFCGWACPIGLLQDIAKQFRKKAVLKMPIHRLAGLFFIGIILFGTIFIVQNVVTGYLGITGVSIIAISLFGLLAKIDKLFVNLSVFFLVLVGLILIFESFWEVPGYREILVFTAEVLLAVSVLAIIYQYITSQTIIRDTKFYKKNKYYLVKYIILIFIPITSFFSMEKLFTDIDPIGGLTAGVPVLMFESEKWVVSDYLWVKFVLIALLFFLNLLTTHGFCRFVCPVGALMSPTNKVSLQDIKYYEENCTKCMKCIKACPMRINVLKIKRDMECIRCGRCIDACEFDAVHMTFGNKIVK